MKRISKTRLTSETTKATEKVAKVTTTTLQNFAYASILEPFFLSTGTYLALIQVFMLQVRLIFFIFLELYCFHTYFIFLTHKLISRLGLMTILGLPPETVQSLRESSLDDGNCVVLTGNQP